MAGRPRVIDPPTKAGADILKFILSKFSTVSAAARAAGVAEPTLRRRINGTGMKRLDLETVAKLESIGIPRKLLVG